jgi:hypothetical protein
MASSALDAARWLRAARSEAVEAGTPALAQLVRVIDRYLSGAKDGLTLDQAAGVATEQGAVPWWTEEDRSEIRRLLFAALNCFVGGGSTRADRMRRALRNYERGPWHQDRKFTRPPAAYAGRVEEHFFYIMKRGGTDQIPGFHTLRKFPKQLVSLPDP